MNGKSLGQASREYGIKDSVLSRWKQEFLDRALILFENGNVADDRYRRIAELERMVGRLTMQLDMAKKHPAYWTTALAKARSSQHAVPGRLFRYPSLSMAGAVPQQLLLLASG
jgi:transposase-like protein